MKNSGINKSFGALTVDEIRQSDFNAAKFTAQVRQQVTTEYPSMRVGNSATDNLFATEDFNIPAGQTFNATRVAWIPVPQGTTTEEVVAKLAALPNSRIYRKISFNLSDVLTDEQKSAVAAGITTMEVFEEKHRVRTSDGQEIPGAPQYSANFWAATAKEDQDFRPAGWQNDVAEAGAVAQVDAMVAAEKEVTGVDL